jgi:hypothetical protein
MENHQREEAVPTISRGRCMATSLYAARSILLFGLLIVPCIIGAQEPKSLQYRYLWDADSRNRPEWQNIGRTAGAGPAGMIWGKKGEIFLADPQNSRVLHINRDGELLGIIGRPGLGPGEFESPKALGFENDTGMLWVLDFDDFGVSKRCSRFVLRDGAYELRDSVTFQTTRSDMIVEKGDSFWQIGTSSRSGPKGTERQPGRIRLVDFSGRVLREFGPIWTVGEDSPWSLLSPSGLNQGRLIELSSNRLAWLWECRPRIEIWSKEGVLMVERVFGSPFSDKPPPFVDSQGMIHSVRIFSIAAYDEEGDLLFITAPLEGDGGARYLGLDTRTLEEKESYYLKRPSGVEAPMTGTSMLVERVVGEIRFYSIDVYSRALVVLYPE